MEDPPLPVKRIQVSAVKLFLSHSGVPPFKALETDRDGSVMLV